ncbi:MAG TPA: UDP-4-amino-4,6-dideoxy-N-acetyl-beta-L-altrosamine transaminase [Elusimicrobia bacterium]|nr:UDP-4-amino-4,6-dideoxy-N-acetyl-beta-L-altrosamine transaminase [Elusimicrobiota bacterium]
MPVRKKRRPHRLVFGQPLIEEPEIREVVDCLRSGWLGAGPRVHRFEKAFRRYKRRGDAIALNSCTSALHLSLLAAGIKPGDEVITTAMTFCATVNAIIHAGAVPVIADVDPATMNIDPSSVAAKITRKTRAIIPVHFAGRMCDMDALCRIAARRRLKVIEDCAHALEAEYRGRRSGTFGDFGCFSFYATKNVSTGDGGMILARRRTDADRVRRLASHGLDKDAWARFGGKGFAHYRVVEAGYKCNMTDVQAAIGIHQLARVEDNWRRRRSVWDRYQEAFSDLPVVRPSQVEPKTRHSYHLYTLLIDKDKAGIGRDECARRLLSLGIGVGVHYLSIPEHPYYHANFGWRPQEYPNAMRIGHQTLSLTISPWLSDPEILRIIRAVRRTLLGR